MHKRRKKSDNSDLLETITSIMREPVKIDPSFPKEDSVPAYVPASKPVQSQDNISHIMILIENVLREFPGNEGFSYGLQLLQLASEKGAELQKKV